MGVIPTRLQDQLDFFDTHALVWKDNAAAIGILPAEGTAIVASALASRTAYNEQVAAHNAAKAATTATRGQVTLTREMAADLIRKIRIFAEAQPDPAAVYAIAQIPAPAAPSEIPPPGLCRDFRVELTPSGGITLTWKCTNPPGAAGTVYMVSRRFSSEGTFQILGASGGDKTFTDNAIPAGSSVVEYRVIGQRSGVSGPEAILTVRFGSGGGTLSFTEQAGDSMKMAA
jgi:hypothetical protein